MRRVMIACAAALLALMLVSQTAQAHPKVAKGCPAAPIWTEVSFITSPSQGDFRETSLYQYYWVGLPDASAAFAAQFDPPKTLEEQYYTLVGWTDPGVDFNQDDAVCVFWIGGTPGQWDGYLSIVDNNSSAAK